MPGPDEAAELELRRTPDELAAAEEAAARTAAAAAAEVERLRAGAVAPELAAPGAPLDPEPVLEEVREEAAAGEPSRLRKGLEATSDEKLTSMLELNGFNAVRAEVLGVVEKLNAVPADAIEAAIRYSDRAGERLRVDPHPDAREALRVAERQSRFLKLARRWRRELRETAERIEATERLTTP